MWRKNSFKLKELNNQSGDVAGIESVTIQIEGAALLVGSKEKMEFTG